MAHSRNVLDLNKKKMSARTAGVARGAASKAPRPASRTKQLRTAAESLEERQARSRSRRRKLRMIALPLLLLFVGGIAYGIHSVSYLPQFRISKIEVSGTQRLSPALVRALVAARLDDGSFSFIARDNIFAFNAGRIERELAGFFPRVRSVQVAQSLAAAGTLEVIVDERQPYALWCADPALSECYLMDDGGFVYAPVSSPGASTTPASSYRFGGDIEATSSPIGSRFAAAHLPGIVAFLNDLAGEGFLVRGATLQGDDDFMVQLDDGFVLMASFGQNAADLGRNLRLVLGSDDLAGRTHELEYVDLRFGNRVYYKLKGQEQSASSTAHQ